MRSCLNACLYSAFGYAEFEHISLTLLARFFPLSVETLGHLLILKKHKMKWSELNMKF